VKELSVGVNVTLLALRENSAKRK